MPQEIQEIVEQTPADEEKYVPAQLMGDVFDRVSAENEEPPENTEPTELEAAEPVSDEEEAEIETPTEGEGADEAENEVSSTPSGPAEAAPSHMPHVIKKHWESLDPEVQAALDAHERKTGAKFSELGAELSRVRPLAQTLDSLIEQHPAFKDHTPETIAKGAAELAAVQVHLDQNPLQAVIDIANTYGVLPQLQQAMSGAKPTDDQSTIMQLNQRIAGLERQLQKGTDSPDIDNLVDTRLNERDAASVIEKFAAEHEHYEEVEGYLPNFIQIARDTNPGASMYELMETGYDMAVNALPGLRAKLQTTGEQPAVPQPNSKQRTVKAAKAAAINVKSNAKGERPIKSQADLMGEAFDRMSN